MLNYKKILGAVLKRGYAIEGHSGNCYLYFGIVELDIDVGLF